MGIPGDAETEVKGVGTEYLDGVVVEYYDEGGDMHGWRAGHTFVFVEHGPKCLLV